MVCAYCGSKTEVINSRLQRRNNQVWRRRQCLKCKSLFTTHEALDLSKVLMVGNEPFLTDKLFTEVLLALQDRKDCYRDAREVTSTVIAQLLKPPVKSQVSSKQVSQATAKVLKRLDRRAWLRYLSEHPSLQ